MLKYGVTLPAIALLAGPSGSGKTTLLDLLAGRKTPSTGRQEGDIIVDGVMREQGKRTSPSIMAYVTQVFTPLLQEERLSRQKQLIDE